jgi:prepilin-type N-terminal cleavage/methylation domain-containing protein
VSLALVHRVRAFTLIEVMIAVLILALGLLGLGAIIPVIVHEQRRSSEATLGVAAANGAEAYIRSRFDLEPALGRSGWDRWFDSGNNGLSAWSPVAPQVTPPALVNAPNAYKWVTLVTSGAIKELNLIPDSATNTPAGHMTLWSNSAPTGQTPVYDRPIAISVQDRLWPTRASQATNTATGDANRPLFVWDFVGRRLPGRAADSPAVWPSPEPQQIQIAVFVRRIDPGIRIPRGAALADVVSDNLTNSPNSPDARAAVATNTLGRPTNTGIDQTGTPRYSPIVQVDAQAPTGGRRDRITILSTDPVYIEQLNQPGQRLVDNLGNIYTVRGAIEGSGGRELIVNPPVAAGISSDRRALNAIKQVIFTPQIPAAVHLFTLDRPSR